MERTSAPPKLSKVEKLKVFLCENTSLSNDIYRDRRSRLCNAGIEGAKCEYYVSRTGGIPKCSKYHQSIT